jgi:hypothetical protein
MSEDNFDIAEAKRRFRIRKALWEAEQLKEQNQGPSPVVELESMQEQPSEE